MAEQGGDGSGEGGGMVRRVHQLRTHLKANGMKTKDEASYTTLLIKNSV